MRVNCKHDIASLNTSALPPKNRDSIYHSQELDLRYNAVPITYGPYSNPSARLLWWCSELSSSVPRTQAGLWTPCSVVSSDLKQSLSVVGDIKTFWWAQAICLKNVLQDLSVCSQFDLQRHFRWGCYIVNAVHVPHLRKHVSGFPSSGDSSKLCPLAVWLSPFLILINKQSAGGAFRMPSPQKAFVQCSGHHLCWPESVTTIVFAKCYHLFYIL